ncbi:hypothetical protein [Streptomyces sp. 8N706]|uniref:hypothetical protein n=1 Tax=Streptomyces sp. 8N706 TaxID=3457416 RepID=UPI003FCFD57E
MSISEPRITVGGHVRALGDLTRHAVLDWLDYRGNRWPNTANPHLLITGRPPSDSALPASSDHPGHPQPHRHPRTTPRRPPTRRGPHPGADPLQLALVFGIDETTAIRYADSARKLLQSEPETGPAWPQ